MVVSTVSALVSPASTPMVYCPLATLGLKGHLGWPMEEIRGGHTDRVVIAGPPKQNATAKNRSVRDVNFARYNVFTVQIPNHSGPHPFLNKAALDVLSVPKPPHRPGYLPK